MENAVYLPQIFEKLSNENLLKFPKAVIEKIIFNENIQYISTCAWGFSETYLMASLPQCHYSDFEFHSQLTFLRLLLLIQKSYKSITGCLAIRSRNQPLIRRQSWISYLLSTEMNEIIGCGKCLGTLERNKLEESKSWGNSSAGRTGRHLVVPQVRW